MPPKRTVTLTLPLDAAIALLEHFDRRMKRQHKRAREVWSYTHTDFATETFAKRLRQPSAP